MNVQFLTWLTFGTVLGVLLGFQFGKGDPQAPLIVGAVGALFGLVGFYIVSAVHRAWKIDPSKTDNLAIIGALLGAICGGVIGVLSGFGRLMISILNPDLLERDFGASFGAYGGIFLGACFGACLASSLTPLLRHRRRRHTETAENKYSEKKNT